MATDRPVVFLDANVLAKPVTRTLLLIGADRSGLAIMWASYVEVEAERHLRSGAVGLQELRRRHDRELAPTGVDPERFTATSVKDRQVLADADAARASYLISEDVDDFGESDVAALRLTAIHPDLFMALRYPRRAYLHALDLLVANMTSPPRTSAAMHALIARQHPRLFAAHADAFGVAPVAGDHMEPAVLFRGVRCVMCASIIETPADLELGLCVDCHTPEPHSTIDRPA